MLTALLIDIAELAGHCDCREVIDRNMLTVDKEEMRSEDRMCKEEAQIFQMSDMTWKYMRVYSR